MNIIWFSWKDIKHPQAGGAEAVSDQIRQRLAADGHNVRLITAQYKGSKPHERTDNVEVYRTGGRISVYPKAFWLFRRKLSAWPDLIIDEMNTLPFGCALYSRKKSLLLTYQLARKVWFYQLPLPFSAIGYVLEPIYLFMLSRLYKTVVTESDSTRNDLARFGFAKNDIGVIRVGTQLKPLPKLPVKNNMHAVLVLGAIRPMKQTLDAIKGFESARDDNVSLELIIAGDNTGGYAQKVADYVQKSRHSGAIRILGRVSESEKAKLMQTSSVIVVTSVKEGWGLIITEANSQGTPAIAYDTDGLRDSVSGHTTGLLAPAGNTRALGQAINALLGDARQYQRLRQQAWESSKQYTYANCYSDFLAASGIRRSK